MFNLGLVALCIIFFLAVVGVSAVLLGARCDARTRRTLQVTRVERNEALAEVRELRVNARHLKSSWDLTRQRERAQFTLIKAREFASDLFKVLDTAAEHVAALGAKENE